MNTPKKSLSRGLGELLNSGLIAPVKRGEAAPPHLLPVNAITTGASQPRSFIDPDALDELAASIKAQGIVQPILVRPLPNANAGTPRYEIVAGERRWRAAQLVGLTEIPVYVRDMDDEAAVASALIENIQRQSLTPAEEARALARLVKEFALKHDEVAQAVGRSRAAVSNLIRLLDLPAAVIALVDSRELSMGHARALLGLDSEEARIDLARVIVDRQLSVRDTEASVTQLLEESDESIAPKRRRPAEVSEVFRSPEVRIKLHQKTGGEGKLIVDFADRELRDAIIEAVKDALSSLRS